MLSMSFLKSFFPVLIPIFVMFSGCQNSFYTVEDYSSVKKIDSHIHINSDKGYFEEQAIEDNFILITLGVDHGDSANIRHQHENATFFGQQNTLEEYSMDLHSYLIRQDGERITGAKKLSHSLKKIFQMVQLQ